MSEKLVHLHVRYAIYETNKIEKWEFLDSMYFNLLCSKVILQTDMQLINYEINLENIFFYLQKKANLSYKPSKIEYHEG